MLGNGAGAGVRATAGGAVDSAEEDSDSESEGEELPEVGLPEPIGDSGLEIHSIILRRVSSLP